MCFGGKSKSPAPVVPAPTPPTTFERVNADTSNETQRKAAILSSTNDQANQPQTFGAELGSAGAATQTGVM